MLVHAVKKQNGKKYAETKEEAAPLAQLLLWFYFRIILPVVAKKTAQNS
jgi:hypothetical protein